MPEITDAQRAAYIADRGQHCPYCGDFRTEGDSMDFDGQHAYQDITCTECGESWRDVYTLTCIEPR